MENIWNIFSIWIKISFVTQNQFFVAGTKPISSILPSGYANTNFGPFYILTSRVENKCVIPSGKVDTEHQCQHNIGVYKLNRYKEEFKGILMVPKDIQNLKLLVLTDIWRDGGYKPFYSRMYENPCRDVILSPLLNIYLSMGKDCALKKGNYTINGVDPYNILATAVGSSFFYEKISLTMAFFSKKGIVSCVKIYCESKPMAIASPNRHKQTRRNQTISSNTAPNNENT